MKENSKQKLLIIDGNFLAYRAYYATAKMGHSILTNSKNIPVNALLTFANMIYKFQNEIQPSHILVAFDMAKKTRRHKKFKEYKAKRKKMPEELVIQMKLIKEMLKKWGIPFFEKEGIEADDIIASTCKALKSKLDIFIFAVDQDLFQLISENVSIILPFRNIREIEIINKDNFKDKFGYLPKDVIEIKSIAGDSSDNLPGVKGIGKIGAKNLISQFKTLDNVYKNLNLLPESTKKKLEENKDLAYLTKELVILDSSIDVPFKLSELKFPYKPKAELITFFKDNELFSLVKKFSNHPKKNNKNTEKSQNISFKNILF